MEIDLTTLRVRPIHVRVPPAPGSEPDLLEQAAWMLMGAVTQVVNEITRRVGIPFIDVPDGPMGDVLEPTGPDARRGARLIERLTQLVTGAATPPSPDSVRDERPLLARTSVQGGGTGTVSLLWVSATTPGARWDSAAAAGVLAVHVDGSYHSSVLVPGELEGAITVNLGELPPGDHDVEIRAALDRMPAGARRPVVSSVTSTVESGVKAMVDAHAPVVEFRDAGTRSGVLDAADGDDAPLAMFPVVTRLGDGSMLIDYRIVFSNENGGTRTPELLSAYGHTLDVEPVLRVHLDAAGEVLGESYQTGHHRWVAFDGERVGGRPLLRVSSAHNMVSARVTEGGTERWSASASDLPDELLTGVRAASDEDVLERHPWIRQVSERELAREGKVRGHTTAEAAPADEQVWDPSRYVAVGPVGDAERESAVHRGWIEVELRDGRVVRATVDDAFATGEYGNGAALLPRGLSRDDVIDTAD